MIRLKINNKNKMKLPKFKIFTVFDDKFESSFITIILGLSTGIGWISLVIWNRLIRERLPRDLSFTVGVTNSIGYYIQLGLFIYFFCLLVFYCHKLYKKIRGIEKPLRFSMYIFKYLDKHDKIINIIQYLSNYVFDGPFFLWRFILINVTQYVDKFVIKFIRLLKRIFFSIENAFFPNNRPGFIKKKIITWVILWVCPRILALSVLLYEIAINKHIEYFYYIAPALLIPVLMGVIRRILFDISIMYTKWLKDQEYFKITKETEEEEDVYVFDFDSDFAPEVFYPYISDFCYWVMLYMTALRFYLIEEKYGLYAKIITYSLLSLSFGLMLLIRLGVY
jgi:hypothetical protein